MGGVDHAHAALDRCFDVDAVGEVMALTDSEQQAKPANLDPRLARVASGVYRLESQLLLVLDVDCVLDIRSGAVAA